MAQNKEQLNKLLKFIKRLVDEPGNEDFANQLRKMLGVISSSSTGPNTKLADIEKYLGLDFRLDSTSPIIDYSFIGNEYVQSQLIADFREMLRYRFGVRSHRIDFSEFCRYAILQTEQLTNYYYHMKFSSFEHIKNYITDNVDWVKLDNIETESSLSLSIKLSALTNHLNNRKIRDVLDFTREVRNSQSHRGNEKVFKSISVFKSYLESLGLPLAKDGEVYWTKIKDNDELKAKYQSINRADYWNYRYQLWHKREPFNEVIDAIQGLTQYIKEDLNKS